MTTSVQHCISGHDNIGSKYGTAPHVILLNLDLVKNITSRAMGKTWVWPQVILSFSLKIRAQFTISLDTGYWHICKLKSVRKYTSHTISNKSSRSEKTYIWSYGSPGTRKPMVQTTFITFPAVPWVKILGRHICMSHANNVQFVNFCLHL
jgi:hypothetical protein